ncbi:MAG: nucleoside triphosphate pyrophosphohydrolase [Thermodesulfobacteriota bacterium]
MNKKFEDLVELTKYLRGPNGCPWDKEQDLLSLRSYIIEEAYEVIQAIESGDKDEMIEEFGDLLHQVVFASQIAKDESRFGIDDVVDQLHNKLVRRHPHVFGDEKAKDAEEAVKTWHRQKLKEKTRKNKLLDIPSSMPALLRAQRVGEKASQVGFDWDNIQDVLKKVKEEIAEIEQELKDGDKEKLEKEWGDLLFAVVNLARHLKIESETVAHQSTEKFIKRFGMVEDMAKEKGKSLTDMSLVEMDELWKEVKEADS